MFQETGGGLGLQRRVDEIGGFLRQQMYNSNKAKIRRKKYWVARKLEGLVIHLFVRIDKSGMIFLIMHGGKNLKKQNMLSWTQMWRTAFNYGLKIKPFQKLKDSPLTIVNFLQR